MRLARCTSTVVRRIRTLRQNAWKYAQSAVKSGCAWGFVKRVAWQPIAEFAWFLAFRYQTRTLTRCTRSLTCGSWIPQRASASSRRVKYSRLLPSGPLAMATSAATALSSSVARYWGCVVSATKAMTETRRPSAKRACAQTGRYSPCPISRIHTRRSAPTIEPQVRHFSSC